MKKIWINFWVEAAMFVSMLALGVTGLIMKYALPPLRGQRQGTGLGPETLFGWDRHDWGDFHFWLAVILVALLVVHLILHWRWIVCRLREFKSNGKASPKCDTE
ncbi:MAG: DUF4405 domain-containing protein [bacterium]